MSGGDTLVGGDFYQPGYLGSLSSLGERGLGAWMPGLFFSLGLVGPSKHGGWEARHLGTVYAWGKEQGLVGWLPGHLGSLLPLRWKWGPTT